MAPISSHVELADLRADRLRVDLLGRTLQQHVHRASLQGFVRLPDARTRRGRALGASLAAVVLACAGALASLATPGAAASAACAGANVHPNATNLLKADVATLCLVNQVRVARGLRPLRANRELGRVAHSQVTAMIGNDYFSDVRPTGQTPLSLVAVTRYSARAAEFSVGQNIAWGTKSFTTPAHVVAEWMASPPHREIMLSSAYRDVGVAVIPAVPTILAASGAGATYAIEFGVRRPTGHGARLGATPARAPRHAAGFRSSLERRAVR